MPRTPKDQYAAEIATDALRFIKEQTRWEYIKADAFLDALKIGFAAVEIGGAEDHVPITPIDWKDFIFDPRSRRHDFSDARYLGVEKWVDKDVALATYVPPPPQPPQALPPPQIPPQPLDPSQLQQWAAMAQEIIAEYERAQAEHMAAYEREVARRQQIIDTIESTSQGVGSDGAGADGFDDRPSSVFCDRNRTRIVVTDLWHQDPKKGWYHCVFTGAGKLFTEEAQYVETDAWGRKSKTHPIKAFSLYVSSDLWRYGEVRGMRSPQDEVNARRSKALHLQSVNQLFYEPGAFPDGDVEKARRELTKPNGVIAVTGIDKYKVDRNLDMARGQQELGAEARAFLEMEGPNPQLQGEQGRATSGRAVLALQQAGLGQLGPIFDRVHDWELRCNRAKWARVQQFWTAPMYVRVTDDKNAAKFAAVNGASVLDENGKPKKRDYSALQPMQGAAQPSMQHPSMMGHNGGPELMPEDMGETGPMLAELDMDIVIDRAPEAATLQAEQFEVMAQLAQAGVLGPPNPDTGRLLVEASALPNKTKLLDLLDKASAMAKQAPPPPNQMAELQELKAKVELMAADTDKKRAETAKIVAETPSGLADVAGGQPPRGDVNAPSMTGGPMQARTEIPDRTMQMPGASFAPGLGAGDLRFAPTPSAAGAQPGALDLPPLAADGPPPF